MNLLDFKVTPLWQVWDAVRDLAAEDGVSPAESELIGLAPAGVLPRCRRPCRRRSATIRSRHASRRRPRTCGCATSPRCRPSSSGSRRPVLLARTDRELRAVPRHRGRPDGRATPGLLLDRGDRSRDDGRWHPARTDAGRGRPTAHRRSRRAGCPDGRVLGGSHRRCRAAGAGRGDARGRRAAAGAVRPGRRFGRDRDSRPHRSAHPSAVRRDARARAGPAPAGRLIPRHPGGRRWHPFDRRRHPLRLGGRAAGPWSPVARRDARPRGDDGRGEVGLRPRPRDGAAAHRRRPSAGAGGADRRRPDVARRARRASGVPDPTRRDRGLRPSPHRRAVTGHRRSRPGQVRRRVLRERGVHRRAVAPRPRGGSGARSRAPAPR